MTEKETLRAELRLRGVDVPDSWSLKQLRAKKAELDKDNVEDEPKPTPKQEEKAEEIAPEPKTEPKPVVKKAEKAAHDTEGCAVKPKFDFNFKEVDYEGDKEYVVSEELAKEFVKQGIANRVA